MSEKTKPAVDWAEWLAGRLGLKPVQAGTVRLLVIMLMVGVLAMTVLEQFGGKAQTRQPAGAREVLQPQADGDPTLTALERSMAADLGRVLSVIRGAGEVEVTVRLSAGPTVTTVTDTRVDRTQVKEDASDNSHRVSDTTNTTTTTVMKKNGSIDTPVVARTNGAEIAGVVVVADGARDSKVRELLTRATVTALKISPNRVTVLPRKGG